MYEYFKIYSILKNEFGFFFHHFFLFFSILKKSSPGQGEVRQGSRENASGLKEMCVGGQGEVRQGSRRSASGIKESASAECRVFS